MTTTNSSVDLSKMAPTEASTNVSNLAPTKASANVNEVATGDTAANVTREAATDVETDDQRVKTIESLFEKYGKNKREAERKGIEFRKEPLFRRDRTDESRGSNQEYRDELSDQTWNAQAFYNASQFVSCDTEQGSPIFQVDGEGLRNCLHPEHEARETDDPATKAEKVRNRTALDEEIFNSFRNRLEDKYRALVLSRTVYYPHPKAPGHGNHSMVLIAASALEDMVEKQNKAQMDTSRSEWRELSRRNLNVDDMEAMYDAPTGAGQFRLDLNRYACPSAFSAELNVDLPQSIMEHMLAQSEKDLEIATENAAVRKEKLQDGTDPILGPPSKNMSEEAVESRRQTHGYDEMESRTIRSLIADAKHLSDAEFRKDVDFSSVATEAGNMVKGRPVVNYWTLKNGENSSYGSHIIPNAADHESSLKDAKVHRAKKEKEAQEKVKNEASRGEASSAPDINTVSENHAIM